MLAMGYLSEDQVAAFIVRDWMDNLSWTKVAMALSIPKASLLDLVNGKTLMLRNPECRESLHTALNKALLMPWGKSLQDLRRIVENDVDRLILADDKQRPELETRVLTWHEEAGRSWIPQVFDDQTDPVSRLVRGRLGAWLTINLLNSANIRNALSEEAKVQIAQDNKFAQLGAVYAEVAKLLSDETAPSLYEEGFTKRKQQGVRWLRFLTWNDHMGWSIHSTDVSSDQAIRERNSSLAELVKMGFVKEAGWAAKITDYQDIIPVKNPWTALVLAGEWSASVAQAQILFREYPDHLTKHCQGEAGIISDRDYWPGLAAIAANPQISGLGDIRDKLANADLHGFPKLGTALKALKPIILNGGSHEEAMAAIRGI